MPDYKRSKIYKIVDNTNGDIYIGSTCQKTLARRLSSHASGYRRYIKGTRPTSMTSFPIIANNNYSIVLIEECPCESKDQLHSRERHYIETLDCVNKYIPTRSKKEYNEDNKEKIKEYREKNKEKKCQQNKEYREKNKEKIKEFLEKNKEKRSQQNKEYREENKEKLKKQKKEKSHVVAVQLFQNNT